MNNTIDSNTVRPQAGDLKVPDIKDLHSGWTSKSHAYPKLAIQDVENYLIHSSHRTIDSKKMQCLDNTLED